MVENVVNDDVHFLYLINDVDDIVDDRKDDFNVVNYKNEIIDNVDGSNDVSDNVDDRKRWYLYWYLKDELRWHSKW